MPSGISEVLSRLEVFFNNFQIPISVFEVEFSAKQIAKQRRR